MNKSMGFWHCDVAYKTVIRNIHVGEQWSSDVQRFRTTGYGDAGIRSRSHKFYVSTACYMTALLPHSVALTAV